MIHEIIVLIRVEHFQHGGGRIAHITAGHLLDFIEQNHGVTGAGLFDSLHDASRHGTNIGAAVSANFCFVVHSAE